MIINNMPVRGVSGSTTSPILAVQISPASAGVTVSAVNSSTTLTGVTDSSGYTNITLNSLGTWTVSADGISEKTVTVSEAIAYPVFLTESKIYGAQWDGSSSTVLSRTDDAALFSDPVPYVAGASSYGSPFDDILPWSGMAVVKDAEAGTLVRIPKFYYKWTGGGSGNPLKIQISMQKQPGFYTSPAHSDRGDGNGERDVVYIGRYHCNDTNYKSEAGTPKTNISHEDARNGIHLLGNNVWQCDFLMKQTIWILYLVEFANWDSQRKIGFGCGTTGRENSGYTDSMPYHTGTMLSSRNTKGLGVQYRNIEALWENGWELIDGSFYNSNGINLIKNPEYFGDTSKGSLIGKDFLNGFASSMSISEVDGIQLIYADAANGSGSTYITDTWQGYTYHISNMVGSGGYYTASDNCGMFFVSYTDNIAKPTKLARLMKLP